MLISIKKLFSSIRFLRMSDGNLVLIRDLGLIKGGGGLRQHERLVSLGLQTAKISRAVKSRT